MADKLQIYACSGVDGTPDVGFVTENTNTATNTQAMNTMLSYMNLFATEVRCLKFVSEKEKEEKMNKLDICSIAFYYARMYRQDKEALHDVGIVLSKLYADGKFDLQSTDTKEHEEHVDNLIVVTDEMVSTGEYTEPTDSAFWEWWQTEVVKGAKEGLDKEQQEALLAAEASAKPVGATITTDYGDLNKYLYDGGTYFIYLYMPENRLSELTYAMRKKRRKQQEVYEYCKKCFTSIYGSEEAMQRVIRSGIVEDFGVQPEDVLEDILTGKREDHSIGQLAVEVIAAIITAIASIIIALIGGLLDYGAKVATVKYTVPNDVEDGMSDPADWEGLGTNGSSNSKVVMIGLAALAALFFINEN